MIDILKRFLFDGDYFAARLRVLIFAVGTLFTQGVITLDVLSATLGPAGWWLGVALSILAVAIRSGDPTPAPLKNLTPDQTAALTDHLDTILPPKR